MGYGLITPLDGRKLEESIVVASELAKRRGEPFHLLEVGICHGTTSRGMADFMKRSGIDFTYWGLDSQRDLPVQVPFEGANVVLGLSEEAYLDVPQMFHFVFIDGCHCVNHCIMDFHHYGDKVPVGGRLMMHDAAPYTQRKLDYQGHGPKHMHDMGTATREAARLMGFFNDYRKDWKLVEQAWEPRSSRIDSGGVLILERVLPTPTDTEV